MHLSSKLLLKIDGLPVLAACLWGRVEGARRRRVRWSQGVRIKALAEVLSLWPPSARVSAFDFLVPRGDIGSRARLVFFCQRGLCVSSLGVLANVAGIG